MRKRDNRRDSLGEVGQVLDGFSNESQVSGCTFVWELLREVEEAGRQNGWAEESEEDAGADECSAHSLLTFVLMATLAQTAEDFFQLSGKEAHKVSTEGWWRWEGDEGA